MPRKSTSSRDTERDRERERQIEREREKERETDRHAYPMGCHKTDAMDKVGMRFFETILHSVGGDGTVFGIVCGLQFCRVTMCHLGINICFYTVIQAIFSFILIVIGVSCYSVVFFTSNIHETYQAHERAMSMFLRAMEMSWSDVQKLKDFSPQRNTSFYRISVHESVLSR